MSDKSARSPNYVYKVLPNTSFFQGIPVPIPASYEFKQTGVDARDGYIHLSTLTQLGGVLNKFFKEDKVVQLIKVDYKRLSAFKSVKWEEASSGDSFAHLYGTLDGEHAIDLKLVEQGDDWEDALRQLYEAGWLQN